MDLNHVACYRAIRQRGTRFDGRFFAGIGFSFVHYLDEFPYFAAEVLPRLERMGPRQEPPA
jgi:hypothetical protein